MKVLARTVLSLMLALAPAHVQAQGDDKTVTVRSDDPEMTAAIEQARASLDDFLALSEAPPPGTDKFKLKVMIVDGDATEHFWVIPFKRTASGFAGILANEPEIVQNVVYGQYIEFSRDDISDWGYIRDGHQVGSYTVCVMLKKMSEQDADDLRSNYGFDC
ncbi:MULTISPECIES: DUF2314 domain-containing protein [unclassified Mesorhizobium]|uniref:YegJ family protein n=1 Tax=unclassified Mesorhizobium TaxID=325217 RepID=UPI000FCCDDBD|nr:MULTISPECIES: DUF2314 domain-containing protein [unclassified Mesorhizobium]RUW75132.1 DUF2314 domain-containing protein [Mesorhizobium sp. M4B.F.Ca.ET.049.02.1.2]TGV28358.1 DUF2314 domain-containing protein [Mesorhizobium sp. M4B.F.Ca.ET.143.01.1.1]